MTSANGCESSDSVFVDVIPIQAGFEPDPQEGEIGVPVNFVDQSQGADNWYWEFGDGANGSGQNVSHSYVANGDYLVMQVVGTDEGCRDTTFRPLSVESIARIFLPSAFSPNGDGVNDEFQPISKYVQNLSLEVFDRFGKLIFQSREQIPGWDGTFQGQAAAEGVYTFNVTGTDLEGNPVQKAGTVTLVSLTRTAILCPRSTNN